MDARPKTLIDRSVLFGTLALGAMPLLGMRPMVLVIAIWLMLASIDFALQRGSIAPRWKEWLILGGPFLLMLLDLLRYPETREGWMLAERSAAFIIFPTGFLLISAPPNKITKQRLLDVFSVSAAILAVFVNVQVLPYLLAAAEVDTTFSVAYRAAFSDISGVHPPYAAYWFFVGALFQLDRLLRPGDHSSSAGTLFLRFALIVVCIASGTVIGSRMPVLAFAIALGALLFGTVRRALAIRGVLVIGVSLFLALLFFPGLRDRAKELSMDPAVMPSPAELTSVNIRTPIAHCTFELLEQHWLAGLGHPHVQSRLDQCYSALGLAVMDTHGYGPHCQPLQWWLAFGFAGLLAFLVLFGWSMRQAWERKDALHLSFLLFMLLCCLTEDLLTRQWGVVLFACFNTLFVAAGAKKESA